jgi:SAM-dependent methyltransferase
VYGGGTARAGALYDRIGRSYASTRGEEPRIAAAVHAALGDARTVLNVGAGTGSYEPRDREVTAVEPSAVMRAQRGRDAAPCVDARAEALPFPDGAFDAAMAVISDHHWPDRAAGLRELRRVARRQVLVQWDQSRAELLWIARDYLPALADGPPLREAMAPLGAPRIVPLPVPRDCRDGFLLAWWARPEALLDPVVRANISVFALLGREGEAAFVARLARDLKDGTWDARNPGLRELPELDVGLRLVTAGCG